MAPSCTLSCKHGFVKKGLLECLMGAEPRDAGLYLPLHKEVKGTILLGFSDQNRLQRAPAHVQWWFGENV